MPCLAGMFIEAPMFAAELEHGIHRLALTQRVTPAGLIVPRLVLVMAPLLASGSLLGARPPRLCTLWLDPAVRSSGPGPGCLCGVQSRTWSLCRAVQWSNPAIDGRHVHRLCRRPRLDRRFKAEGVWELLRHQRAQTTAPFLFRLRDGASPDRVPACFRAWLSGLPRDVRPPDNRLPQPFSP